MKIVEDAGGLEADSFSYPRLFGALDAIADDNRRLGEPPLFALVANREGDAWLSGHGYFRKHTFLATSYDALAPLLYQAHLERMYKYPRESVAGG
jgi:hypothetical protein